MAGRLALVFCALAIFSTALALVFQDRALHRDLARAAHLRLDRSARAADQLLRGHLHSVAARYQSLAHLGTKDLVAAKSLRWEEVGDHQNL